MREIYISDRIARVWIKRLVHAGFLKLPSELTGGLQDTGRLQLQLNYGEHTNQVLSTTILSKLPKDIQDVVKELRETIDPVNRWACIPGDWPACKPLEPK